MVLAQAAQRPVVPRRERIAAASQGKAGSGRIEPIQANRNSFVLGVASPQPAAAAIRGNRRSKIYHRSDCSGYDRIAAANLVAFADEAAASHQGHSVFHFDPNES